MQRRKPLVEGCNRTALSSADSTTLTREGEHQNSGKAALLGRRPVQDPHENNGRDVGYLFRIIFFTLLRRVSTFGRLEDRDRGR